MWVNFGKYLGKVMLILLVGILLGFVALCLVHLLPVERMKEHVLEGRDAINAHAQAVPGYMSTSIDNYTDSIMLGQAICPVDAPLLEKVIYNYQVNYWMGYEQQKNLFCYLDGEEGFRYQGYTHYWGGWQVLLKPLLLLFDYADILIINGILQTLLTILVVWGLCKQNKQYMILPFMVTLLSIMPMAVAVCLQFSDVYYIALIGMLLIVWRFERIGKERMYLLFLVLGMCTSYFDFLTYPLVSLGLPLVMFITYNGTEKIIKQIFYLLQCSVSWCIGYVGMWSGKWLLGSILMPEAGSLSEALSSIAYRSSNRATGMEVLTAFDVLLANLYVYLKWPVLILLGGTECYLIWGMVKTDFSAGMKEKLLSCIPYLLICAYPIGWYMLATNHSFEHTFMAYRELAIASFAGLCMLAQFSEGNDKE